MDPVRLGHSFRALRLNRRWRQVDVGAKAGISASEISRIELGRVDRVSVGALRRVAESLDASLDVRLRWNGEGLDRLLDQAHAGLVDQLVVRLRAAGWIADVEVSFSIRGERGSIDVLGFHPATGIVLVTEVKSVVPDSQRRLPASIARHGWRLRSHGAGDRIVAEWPDCWSSATRRRLGVGSMRWLRHIERRFRWRAVQSHDGSGSPMPRSQV
jgi:transcriptional regulator with XRE-family HTH domain